MTNEFLKSLFKDEYKLSHQVQIYLDFCKMRKQQIEKVCYCGHTIDCDCGNPTFEDFKHNILNNNLKVEDLK